MSDRAVVEQDGPGKPASDTGPGLVRDIDQLKAALRQHRLAPPRSSVSWLLEQRVITAQDVERVRPMLQPGELLESALLRHGAINQDELDLARAASTSVPLVDVEHFRRDPKAVAILTASWARSNEVLPLCFDGPVLVVACADPSDVELEHMLAFTTDRIVELVMARPNDLQRAIMEAYGPNEDATALAGIQQSIRALQRPSNEQDLAALAHQAPVVRLVQNLLTDAIRQRASDIHIRPLEDSVEVLFRIDGQLVTLRHLDKTLLPAVVSRLKTIGGMNVAEHRVPQDGRARMVLGRSDVDLRLSCIPMVQGESVVVRVLDANEGLRDLGELGFTEADADRFADLLTRTTGLLLVTGPTGCGKSTTLYAALQALRPRHLNVVTVENPVEYRLPEVNQIQVNTTAGLTFAKALRHILRHDPDAVMIGEIRDQETAKIAVEASLTGHLVLSTLHTNDAATAVTRLVEIGIEPYLVSSSLLAVLAQRLVRRNCPHCVAAESIEPTMAKLVGAESGEAFVRGAGCHHCHGTGYLGRHAVYELMTITPELRARIADGASAVELASLAHSDGMIPLTTNALSLARQGITSLAEVMRVRIA
ncbi:MAG: type II/IV secretion system protein [Gammaproteobacteria bacterium]|nr:MAG: type II/IV secretion system protein [Gammaproteobacteria bacterium]